MNAAGIDVSSRKSTVAALRPFSEVVRLPFDVVHSAEEPASLAQQLKELDGETRIVMEHTGHYYESGAKALHDTGFYVSAANPLLISVVAFLCCPFGLPTAYKIFFCQVSFGT